MKNDEIPFKMEMRKWNSCSNVNTARRVLAVKKHIASGHIKVMDISIRGVGFSESAHFECAKSEIRPLGGYK